MTPKLLIDCDGVLANFSLGISKIGLNVYGVWVDPNSLSYAPLVESIAKQIASYKDIPYDTVKSVLYNEASKEGFGLSLNAYDGAREAIAELQTISKVIVVTATFAIHKTWVYERTEWLNTHMNIVPEDVIFAYKKQHVKGDIFVDDTEEKVVEWQKDNLGDAYLWSMPHNRNVGAGLKRLNNWGELVTAVKRIA